MKTKEEILIEQDWSKDITVPFETMYFETTKSILTAMQLYANQESAKAVKDRNKKIREFIFNTHNIRDGYVGLKLGAIIQFLSTPTDATTSPTTSILDEVKRLRDEYQESVDSLDNVHPDKWKLILQCQREKYLAVQNAHMQFVMKLDKIIGNDV